MRTRNLILLGLLLLALSLGAAPRQSAPTIHVLYFYSNDCPHCIAVRDDVLQPLQARYGAQLAVHMFEINTPASFEGMVRATTYFRVPNEQRAIPTLVIGENILIGEDEIRAQLPGIVESGLASGIPWPPSAAGLDTLKDAPTPASAVPGGPIGPGQPAATPAPTGSGACSVSESASGGGCATAQTVWAAYFYQVGCEVCAIAKSDIAYVRQKYPNLVVQEFNIYDQAALATWMGERAGRKSVRSPAVFIGQDALVGGEELTPAGLEALVVKYQAGGAERTWDAFDPATSTLVERFRALGPMTIAFAGLVDGLNPCAFATLVFFVSYLAISGRKGRQILTVGAAFTLGVFLAYLAVGLGFYKVLELLGGLLTTISHWVYGITAVFCAGLAVLSFADYRKARRGDLGEMALNLPHALRMRINRVIRENRSINAYAAGAFATGLVVSFLELACTGQIYLPTIIFVSSMPALRAQAVLYLLLYNLMFIVPLLVVFGLAYYGTTSRDLTGFLEKRAAAVKLGMALLFTALAVWLAAGVFG